MVIQIRVDDRLIHGQVALVWSKELNTPGIVVANDNAVNNKTVGMTLHMAAPVGIKLLVKTVEDSKKVFNDARGHDMRMFCLVNCVKDAWELVRDCPGQILAVNVANVGRFDGKPISEKHKIVGDGYLTKEDLDAAINLCNTEGLDVFHQIIPTDPKVDFEQDLRKRNLI